METSSKQIKKSKRSISFSGLELKLDELRKEISADDGSILPHTVLSTQQIGSISSQKPDSLQKLESIIGKLKTEKYGDRILEVMRHEAFSEQLVEDPTKEETCKSRSRKRAKTQKDAILVESSGEEEA